MAEDGPWLKYQQQPAPAEGAPWEKYQQQGPAADEPGFLSRLWSGMLGQDVSRAGRVGMGMADPAVGMGQLAAHGNLGLPMSRPLPKGVPEAADRAVQQRETGYEQREKAAGLTGGLSSEWARLLGNVASPVNVAGAGAAGAPASSLGRIGLASGLGAVSGALEPAQDKSAGTIAKQAGIGAAGGAVLGGAGEAVGSLLGRAIAGNSPQMVDQYLTSKFRNVVKPGRGGQANEPQLGMQDRRILTAVDQIVDNKAGLTLTDEAGNQVRGALPRSIRQFSQAIDQTKKSIYQQYDAMAQVAGGKGAQVDLMPIAQQIREAAAKPAVIDFHPNVATELETMARNMEKRGLYTASEAQDVIQNLNETLAGFYRNPTKESVSFASGLAPVAKSLREGLNAAIEGAEGPGYQALKLRHGALQSVEKDVAGAVQREANKLPGGIGGIFADMAATEQAIHGVLTLDPSMLVRAVGLKAAKGALKYINSPNRAIAKLFSRAATRGAPPSPLQQGIGEGVQAGMPAMGGVTGGVGGNMMQYPWAPTP